MFNIGKGRAVECFNRVVSNDPATSALIVVPLATAGLESQASLEDKDDLGDLLSGTTNEATGTGWARKVLTDADLGSLPAPDDTNNRFGIALPTLTWVGVADSADDVSALVVAYDADTGAGTDADILPLVDRKSVV